MSPPPRPRAPLSRRFDVSSVRDAAVAFRVEATAAERSALAADCDLPGIDALSADLLIARDREAALRVTGEIKARVWQTCVATLDAFASDVAEDVDVVFAPAADVEAMVAARAAPHGHDEDDTEDLPDPIVGGRIDLGALVTEILVLGLDPYPRKPGAIFDEPVPEGQGDRISPFSVLRKGAEER